MTERRSLLNLALYTAGALLFASSSTALAKSYEPLPVFKADQILEPKLRKSTVHEVRQTVRNDGYMNLFIIDSSFGRYEAVGKPMLLKRINEIDALARLSKMSSTRVAGDKAKEVGTNIVTAPARSVEFLNKRLQDPEGTKEMVKAVPGGVANLFRSASDAVKTGAGAVSGKSKADAGEPSKKKAGSTSTATDYATRKTLDYTGYNKTLRRWYLELGVDPFTDNEPLQKEIRRVAKVESSVGFAGKFAPGPPSVPGVKDANKYFKKLEDIAVYDDPKKIQELNQKILRKLGKSEKETRRFVDNPHFTPTTRTLFLNYLDSLENVKNVDRLIASAGNAKSPTGAMYRVQAVEKLAEFHKKEQPLDQIVTSLVLPAGVTKAGHLYVPLPVDYLVWSEEVAGIFRGFNSRVSREHKIASAEVRIAGGISKRCKAELQKLGLSRIRIDAGYD